MRCMPLLLMRVEGGCSLLEQRPPRDIIRTPVRGSLAGPGSAPPGDMLSPVPDGEVPRGQGAPYETGRRPARDEEGAPGEDDGAPEPLPPAELIAEEADREERNPEGLGLTHQRRLG